MPAPVIQQPVNPAPAPTPIAPPPAPAQKSIALPIILSVAITALLVGGSVFAWSQMSLQSSEDKLADQISMLENKLEKMELDEKVKEEEEKEEEKIVVLELEEEPTKPKVTSEKGMMSGTIHASEKLFGSVTHYLQMEKGRKDLNLSCNKLTGSINAQVEALEGTGINTTLITYENPNLASGGFCVTGVIVDTGNPVDKQSGKIKEYTLDKQFGSVTHYLELSNGLGKKDLALSCHKHTLGIDAQVMNIAGKEIKADLYLYKNPSPIGGGSCISGITIREL